MLSWFSKNMFFPLWEIKDGANRLKYLQELSASQWLSYDTLYHQQWESVQQAIKYAYDHCSYYHSGYGSLGFDGTLRSWADFRQLPLLSKNDIRANLEQLISDQFRREDLVEAKTGGSTGTALTLYFDEKCQEMRNAAAMRSDRWAGWDIGMKVAAIWGNPPIRDTFKKKIRNALLDRMIYLDTMDINENSVRRFIDQWYQQQPRFIFGHSHSIYILATYLSRLNIKDIRPIGIIATSMMLLEVERQVIEKIFGCQVTNRYGCEEVGLIACECEQHNGLHLNIDHLVIEFLRDDGTEAKFGEEANIVVTDLINRGMPLIRYKVEDRGVLTDRRCSCGRGLPILERIVGRQADFLKRLDGSLVAGVSLVERTLTAIPGIEQMQLIQNETTILQVKIVKSTDYTLESEIKLKRELISVFGDKVLLKIDYVKELNKTNRGKYLFAVCNI